MARPPQLPSIQRKLPPCGLFSVFHARNSSCCAAALQVFCCNPAPSGTLSKKQLAAGAALRAMCSCSRFLRRRLWALLPFLLLLMHLRNARTGGAAGFAMPSCSTCCCCCCCCCCVWRNSFCRGAAILGVPRRLAFPEGLNLHAPRRAPLDRLFRASSPFALCPVSL